jgi:Holliday junction resolvasome RuvABC ATP-dependent DNA helicase subunit
MQLITITDDIRRRVNDAFGDLVGQTQAISMLKRKLGTALAQPTPSLGETILLAGPASTGKTTLASRMASVLGLPFVEIDGKTIKTREQMFMLLETAANAADTPFIRQADDKSGLPVLSLPPMMIFIDEAQQVSEDLQGALLAALEPKQRRVVISHIDGKRVMLTHSLCMVLATTHPNELSDAFRSRCAEIKLQSYSIEEVAQMALKAAPMIGSDVAKLIGGVSRAVPRQAMMYLKDAFDESTWSGDSDLSACVRRVAKERGIASANGISRNDERYMEVLYRNKATTATGGKPLGLNTVIATLYDLEREEVVDEIEAWLLKLGYINIVQGGRVLTGTGQRYVQNMIDDRDGRADGRAAAAGGR